MSTIEEKIKKWVSGIDYPSYMTVESLTMLGGGYLIGDETPASAISRAAKTAEKRLLDLAKKNKTDFSDLPTPLSEKFVEIIWKNSFCLSTPMWANMGDDRGLPISCYGSHIADSIPDIALAYAEVMTMSALGGGTSGTFSEIRGKGAPITNKGVSKGSAFFATMFDKMIGEIDQGNIRKGAFAGFMSIEHPDFPAFIEFRKHESPVQRMLTGVIVPDSFVEKVKNREQGALERWAKLLEARSHIGLPYIFFVDNANNSKPECYENDLIEFTNLCTEIMLPTNIRESFVCCVASMNAMRYDDWKDNDDVFYGILFMEAVMEDFIQKLESSDESTRIAMRRALAFAKNHRALGMGLLGYHSYLQSKMHPFSSAEASMLNGQIFATLKKKSEEASKYLATKFGEVEKTKGTGRRHTTLLAVAPTTSNASISGGWSAGIEPLASNYYVVKLAKGKFVRKNQLLEDKLEEIGYFEKESKDVFWDRVMRKGGSIQDEDLPQDILSVFKTFSEINQYDIIRQAAIRQVHIDQGQSLNLSIPPNTAPRDVNALVLEAHSLGIKALYYQRSHNILREAINTMNAEGDCEACSG